MTYKCANGIFYAGGLDPLDLTAGRNGNKYFAGDLACNIGANKNTELFADPDALTAEGCAPALCPNNRGLSNMVWGTCELNAAGAWRWVCGGKLENGITTKPLCPDGIVFTESAQQAPSSGTARSLEQQQLEALLLEAQATAAARQAQPPPSASAAPNSLALPLSVGAAGVAGVSLLVVGAVLVSVRRLRAEQRVLRDQSQRAFVTDVERGSKPVAAFFLPSAQT
jgi:hypothetical protein